MTRKNAGVPGADRLQWMVDKFLREQWDFATLDREFSDYYVDDLSDAADLTDGQWELYSRTHERLEWTAHDPDPEERDSGWIDESEFRDWLTRMWPRAPNRSQ